MSDETDALSDMGSDQEADYYLSLNDDLYNYDKIANIYKTSRAKRMKEQSKRENRYNAAKQAKTGETITCAGCGKGFKKKSYQQAFCSNKGKGNCKDTYWNRTDKRVQRSIDFNA